MGKTFAIMALVLAMVLPMAACAGEVEETALPPVEEIVNGVIESSGDLITYQFDMDWTMNMVGEGEAFDMNVDMDISGALDLENRQMRAEISTRATMPGEDEEAMEREVYIIDTMVYVMMKDVWGMGTWMKTEISEADWEDIVHQTMSTIELLETAEAEVIGSETIRDIDCYVLKLTPDMEQLWQIVVQQAEITETQMPDIPEIPIQQMVRDFSVKQWVAKDTYFLIWTDMEMTLAMTPRGLGLIEEEGEVTMDIRMTWLIYDHNEPVSIVLPAEAVEAPDFS